MNQVLGKASPILGNVYYIFVMEWTVGLFLLWFTLRVRYCYLPQVLTHSRKSLHAQPQSMALRRALSKQLISI